MSVNLCLSQPAWTATTKRREHNLIVHSCKSEAELVHVVLLKLLTDTKHCTASLRSQATCSIVVRTLCIVVFFVLLHNVSYINYGFKTVT